MLTDCLWFYIFYNVITTLSFSITSLILLFILALNTVTFVLVLHCFVSNFYNCTSPPSLPCFHILIVVPLYLCIPSSTSFPLFLLPPFTSSHSVWFWFLFISSFFRFCISSPFVRSAHHNVFSAVSPLLPARHAFPFHSLSPFSLPSKLALIFSLPISAHYQGDCRSHHQRSAPPRLTKKLSCPHFFLFPQWPSNNDDLTLKEGGLPFRTED